MAAGHFFGQYFSAECSSFANWKAPRALGDESVELERAGVPVCDQLGVLPLIVPANNIW